MIIISAVELGASNALVVLVVAIAGLGATLSNLPAGQLVARLGERRSMHVGVLPAHRVRRRSADTEAQVRL